MPFNTIVPQRLISKLDKLGLSTYLCNWLLDFLCQRPQVVRVGDKISASITLSTGAPQGCMLSLLLFTLLTHDCTATYSDNRIVKFADDTTLVGLITKGDETQYRLEADLLTMWCRDNNLLLNVDKTKEINGKLLDAPSTASGGHGQSGGLKNHTKYSKWAQKEDGMVEAGASYCNTVVALCDGQFILFENVASDVSVGGTFQFINFGRGKEKGVQHYHLCAWGIEVMPDLEVKGTSLLYPSSIGRALKDIRHEEGLLFTTDGIVSAIRPIRMVLSRGSTVPLDKHRLQRTIRTAEKIIEINLPSIQDLYLSRTRKRARNLYRPFSPRIKWK
ncbi:uncharacterized protein ACBT44_006945 isoform 3-T4 [Syngnathus typhle]